MYLSRIAGKIPGKAKLQSTVKRLDRFLDNPAIRVREWYKPIAVEWLAEQYARIGEIHLIVDGTKVGFGHQLLMVSLAYRKRAIPIAWTWVKHVRGHSTGDKQIALLAYVKTLIPRGAAVFLVGDTEFGPVKVLKQLDKWYWYYVLRQKSDTLVWSQTENAVETLWQLHFESWSELLAWKNRTFRKHIMYPVNLLAYWKSGEKEPWCLATNLPDLQTALRFYKRRMWIEEMFGDLKKHGFDLECSMLHSFLRLIQINLGRGFPVCLAGFFWCSYHSSRLAPSG